MKVAVEDDSYQFVTFKLNADSHSLRLTFSLAHQNTPQWRFNYRIGVPPCAPQAYPHIRSNQIGTSMNDRTRNVFISHIHEDDAVLHGLRDLLKRNGYEIRDGSIDSSKPNDATNPAYIKSEFLAPRIVWASTMVVLISSKTHESPWVEWEIEYAQKQGKRIVGVWDQGARDSNIPSALDKYADAVVGWQADRVMDAINGSINNWETASGEVRTLRDIVRIRCQ
jgi:hypothetical protein